MICGPDRPSPAIGAASATPWRRRGINLDVDLVQGVQGLNTGGSFRNHDSIRYPYGGHAEYTLNVDTGKLGLWPGGFLSIMGESQFGSYLQGKQTGALLPPNAAALYPMPVR